MQNGDYTIVRYRPEFKQQVAEAQRLLWGQDLALNVAYLEWKHEDNPYVSAPLVYVCLFEERVVGTTGFFGTKWQIGSPPCAFVAPCGGDSTVHPDHRRRGIFYQMNEVARDDLARDGYEYLFSLGTNEKTMSGALKLGYRSAGYIEAARRHTQHTRALGGAGSLIRNIARKTPIIPAAVRRFRMHRRKRSTAHEDGRSRFQTLDESRARHSRADHASITVEAAPRPEAMAELLRHKGTDARLRQVRDRDFFAWRFKNPRSEYRFLFWDSAAGLEGYLILHAWVYRERGGISIVDWEATNPQVRTSLLQAAVEGGGFDSLAIWSASLSTEERELLREFGFSFANVTENVICNWPSVLVRPIRQAESPNAWVLDGHQLLDLDNWDLRAIYSDAL